MQSIEPVIPNVQQFHALHAYYEMNAYVPLNRHLEIDLPAEVPAGRVRIAVIYQIDSSSAPVEKQAVSRNIKALLSSMPDVVEDADFARQQDVGREDVAWGS
ncbi:MAG: hypothetical protein HQL60_06665 [Magnetococcales bacterium]|nr:hypothetical protein [Magnetococcales bacterium]